MTTTLLDGRTLTIETVVRIARDRVAVALSGGAKQRVADGEAYLERLIADGRPILGGEQGLDF